MKTAHVYKVQFGNESVYKMQLDGGSCKTSASIEPLANVLGAICSGISTESMGQFEPNFDELPPDLVLPAEKYCYLPLMAGEQMRFMKIFNGVLKKDT